MCAQREFREARERHEALRRQGQLDEGVEQLFDEDAQVEGDVYRLGMTLDDLQHTIHNNVRVSAQPRQPFQQRAPPVKANHSIAAHSMTGTVKLCLHMTRAAKPVRKWGGERRNIYAAMPVTALITDFEV